MIANKTIFDIPNRAKSDLRTKVKEPKNFQTSFGLTPKVPI